MDQFHGIILIKDGIVSAGMGYKLQFYGFYGDTKVAQRWVTRHGDRFRGHVEKPH